MADTNVVQLDTNQRRNADRDAAIVDEVLREFEQLESSRGIFESHWEEVARVVLPYYSTSFNTRGNVTPGQERSQHQYDVTANMALWKFGSTMESMLTPANGKWHKLRPIDAALKKDREVRLWFDQVNELMFHYRYSPHSGYQAQQHDAYIGTGAFGTSCVFTDEYRDPTRPFHKGLRYRNIHLGELFFAVNFQGQVDKAYRRFKMTLRQIAQKFGPEVLGDKLRGQLKEKPETETFVIHCVKPNPDFDYKRLDAKGKRFVSYYILREVRTLAATGGYRCFPYSVSRYVTAPGELYGRSPAMNVLPGIRVLNEEKKTILKQGHRVVDPVLLAHDDGILEGFTLKPGAVNYGAVNSQGQKLVHTLETGNIAIGKELMDDERLAINDAFLVTLFQILVETPSMTATEVLERAREKGALLSPTMGRYQSEALGPMIEREFDLLMYQGLLPKPPRALMEAGGDYQVEYDAPLNRMMRAEEGAGAMRTFAWAAEMAAQTQDPSVMDWFDTDAMVPELADINGMPVRWVRGQDDVAAIREKREADQAAAQITQALPGMAQMMKATNPEGTSANVGQPA